MQRREERWCNNQPGKRGARAEEREATERREEKAVTPQVIRCQMGRGGVRRIDTSDPPPDVTRQHEENQYDNKLRFCFSCLCAPAPVDGVEYFRWQKRFVFYVFEAVPCSGQGLRVFQSS